jgi:squalene cyclase
VHAELPETVARLFWDVEPHAVDLQIHVDYVLERVMSRGDWEAMKWLRATYSQATLASFLERKGSSRLAPRELAYWSLMAGISAESSQGGGRPRWAGQ